MRAGMGAKSTLVCFAVKEEIKFFKGGGCRTLLTGMGQKNAAERLQKELALKPAGADKAPGCIFASAA